MSWRWSLWWHVHCKHNGHSYRVNGFDSARLLIHTSFFDSVTGPLAVAVTGIEDSGELLAELARSNSFVLRQPEAPDRYPTTL